MRVLFGAVLCILIDSKILLTSAQVTNNTISTETTHFTSSTTPVIETCTGLDPPQNLTLLPNKTSAILVWSYEQRNPYCTPVTITVYCQALVEENKEGWPWTKNSEANSSIDYTNNTVLVFVDNLSEFTNYTCNGTLYDHVNSSDPTEIKFQTQEEVSDAPYDLFVTEKTSTNFTVTWKKPVKNPGVFITYRVHIISKGPNHFIANSCMPNFYDGVNETTDESYTFLEASPDYTFQVTVLLINSAGSGTPASINVTTDTAASEAPTQFALQYADLDIEQNIIYQNISWNMPCNTNGEIELFQIILEGYYIFNTSFQDNKTIIVNATEDSSYYIVTEVRPASSYKIWIRANGINETGEFFGSEFITEDNFPGPPVIEGITEHSANNFTIIWKAPERRAGNITGYNVSIISLGPLYDIDSYRCPISEQAWNRILGGDSLQYTFTEADPYYEYRFVIAATTSKGYGSTSTIIANTTSTVPEAPYNLKTELLAENTIGSTSWKTPCNINGPINGFFITIEESYTEDDSATTFRNLSIPYHSGTYDYVYNMSLLESHIYEVTVWITLQDGKEGLKNSSRFTTPDGYPAPPSVPNITNETNESFTISWNRPVKKNGKIMEYQVNVTSLEPLYETNCDVNYNYYNYNTSGNVTFFTFDEGQPYYNYSISVRARTVTGWGLSSIANAMTAPSIPENVMHISHVLSPPTQEKYNAYMNITFEPPCEANGPSLYYELELRGTRENNEPVEDITTSYTNLFNHIPLSPEYAYTFTITTNNTYYNNTSYSTKFISPSGIPQFSNPTVKVDITPATSGATIELKKEYFDVKNGDIKYLALILSEKNETGGIFSSWNATVWPNVNRNGYTQLTEDWWYPFNDQETVTFVVGNQTTCSDYQNNCNKPLQSDKDYYLILRIFTRHFYKNSNTISFRTADTSKLGVILGVIFGLLVFALFGFAGFFVWRKKLIKLPPTLFARKSSIKTIPDGNTSIPIHKFIQYCKNLENNPEKFAEQYMLLTEKSKELMSTHTTTFAELTENRRKNRYTNILPYDETRVKLLIDEDDEIGSDYINASYIRGYSGNVEYIATQGPLPTTCRDFWKMVIQENVSIIVMVAQFIEDNKEKCYKYFPNNHESMTIGDDMEVKCTMELHFGTYCVRTIQVKKDSTQVTVMHMQYLDWPDFNVPKGTGTMLQFCLQLRERLKIEGGCVIVHCSAGVGRTGTLIATDILIQSINAGKNIDIFNTVLELRKQRMSMVQAQKQYVYIHNLIRDTLESHTSELNEILEPIYENQSAIQMKTDDDNLINKQKERESQF